VIYATTVLQCAVGGVHTIFVHQKCWFNRLSWCLKWHNSNNFNDM